MELINGNLTAELAPVHTMSGNLTVPIMEGTTTFEDTGNGNIVITSTTLTAHDNGGNITIEG